MGGTFSAPPLAADTSSGATIAEKSPKKSARVSPDTSPGMACPMLVTANADRSTSVVDVSSSSGEVEVAPKANVPKVGEAVVPKANVPKVVAVVIPEVEAKPKTPPPTALPQQFSIASSSTQQTHPTSDVVVISVHSSSPESAAPASGGDVRSSQSPIRPMSPPAPSRPPNPASSAVSLTPISKASS